MNSILASSPSLQSLFRPMSGSVSSVSQGSGQSSLSQMLSGSTSSSQAQGTQSAFTCQAPDDQLGRLEEVLSKAIVEIVEKLLGNVLSKLEASGLPVGDILRGVGGATGGSAGGSGLEGVLGGVLGNIFGGNSTEGTASAPAGEASETSSGGGILNSLVGGIGSLFSKGKDAVGGLLSSVGSYASSFVSGIGSFFGGIGSFFGF